MSTPSPCDPQDRESLSQTVTNYQRLRDIYREFRSAARDFALSEGHYFRVIVCGSNRISPDSHYYLELARYGALLKQHNIDLGTGVGYGAMEAVSLGHQSVDSSLAMLLGVPVILPGEGLDSYAYTDYRAFLADDFHARLIMMDAIGTLWVITPGAVGTMLELLYVKQHTQFLLKDVPIVVAKDVILKNQGVHLGYVPPILLYNPPDSTGEGFYSNYLKQVQVWVREGMLSEKEAAGVLVTSSVDDLIVATLAERDKWRQTMRKAGIEPRN